MLSRAREEDKHYDDLQEIRRTGQMQLISEWHSAQDKGYRLSQFKRTQKHMDDELALANQTHKEARRQRLAELLEREHQMYADELHQKGLAILRD